MKRSNEGAWVAHIASLAFLLLVPGCFLQRNPLSITPAEDAGPVDAHVPEDGEVPDAGTDGGPDGGPNPVDAGDAGMDPDAGSDGGSDGGPDAGMPDGGRDAGPVDGGSFNTCSDEVGICLRLENTAGSPSVEGWMINIIWTRMASAGGGVIDEGWVSETCLGGIRREDAFTTECRFNMPARPADATADLALVYAYPVYAGFVPACSASSCPNYPAGYTIWKDMAVQAHSTEGRSGTPAGSLFVIRTAL